MIRGAALAGAPARLALPGVARRQAQNSSRSRRRYQAALARVGRHLAAGTPPADPADTRLAGWTPNSGWPSCGPRAPERVTVTGS